MKDMLSEEQSAQLSSEVAAAFAWADDADMLWRVSLLTFLSARYLTIKRDYCDASSVSKLLDNEPWLIPVIDKHWKEGSFHLIRRLREYLEDIS
jgi:hypothetical protein